MPTNTAASQARLYQEYQKHYMSLDLGFATTNVAQQFPYKLPAGCIVTDVKTAVAIAGNAGTTNTVKVGTSSGASDLAAAVAAGTVGVILSTTLATAPAASMNPQVDTPVWAEYDSTGTAASAGAMTVIVEYIVKG